MPRNHEGFSSAPTEAEDLEETIVPDEVDPQEKERLRAEQRQLGAKVLTLIGFEAHHKDIVGSSFDKARKKGEKLPGKNNERRNLAYLSRLDSLIEKHGNAMEKRLWEASIPDLIVNPEDIPDSYWVQQEQIKRDNGRIGRISDNEKQALTENIREQQKESLESWSTYLGDEKSPYPLWFKIFAWDGMSKMGVFDKEKQLFAKRDKTTVAPYPKLNPAVLAKVFRVVAESFGGRVNPYEEGAEQDAEMQALAKSGNFNKLYSKILLEQKVIPKTPERTEDIHGDWVEYLPGEEERLANAAEGTPWCVADPGTGRRYLEEGGLGSNVQQLVGENMAKFILFHLQNPETGTLSESACASVRLGLDGNVAEVSGLNKGQAVEDSLVPIVEEKVRSLPGGEKFLRAFSDKKKLIALDRKLKSGEKPNKEDMEFIYELERPIEVLDTYNRTDPRTVEIKTKYGVEYALDVGVDAKKLAALLGASVVVQHFDAFDRHGAGLDFSSFASKLSPYETAWNLKELSDHGFDVDIDDLVSRMGPHDIVDHFEALASRGANIDAIVAKLGPDDTARVVDGLLRYGADANVLLAKLWDLEDTGPINVTKFLNFLDYGVGIEKLIPFLRHKDIVNNLDTILSHQVNVNQIMSLLTTEEVIENMEVFEKHGIKVDVRKLQRRESMNNFLSRFRRKDKNS